MLAKFVFHSSPKSITYEILCTILLNFGQKLDFIAIRLEILRFPTEERKRLSEFQIYETTEGSCIQEFSGQNDLLNL